MALTRSRVIEGQLTRMQHRSPRSHASAHAAVLRVADHRMTNRSQVHTNLVGATC
ncbi:MAG: hypothetical protein RLZ29_1573, partial [Actinomycetota bacterium]